MDKRMTKSLIGGVVLGLICVVGAYIRLPTSISLLFLFSLWYNRVILGLVIGAPWPETGIKKAMIRGAILGLLVSFAFYASSAFADPVSFIAGGVYGVILEVWLSR